jgi:glycerol uptake facilitator-like aquaporin
VSYRLSQRLVAEFLGTALLVGAVVSSGVMGERLANGNAAIALLTNTIATGAILFCLIATFGPISGAHFNPVVSLACASRGALPWREVPAHLGAQIAGGCIGAVAAHLMFGLPPVSLSQHARHGLAQGFSEFLATFGLVLLIDLSRRKRVEAVALVVATYITAAYWCTSSTSFANPAVTIARGLSDTFAGIAPADIPSFLAAQGLGALSATLLGRWLRPTAQVVEPERVP